MPTPHLHYVICAFGAVEARPVVRRTDIVARCLSSTSRAKCFVKASAGFESPWTLKSLKSPLRSPACTQSWPTVKWRTLPIPLRLQLQQLPLLFVRRWRVSLRAGSC